MGTTWDSAVKTATKILGDKAKIPKFSPTITKTGAALSKSYEEFNKTREELKKNLLALQAASDGNSDAYGQFQDQIDENNLGLDPKDKDEAKQIAEAKKVLSGWLQDQIDNATTNHKNLRELDRHLMDIINYKQGA